MEEVDVPQYFLCPISLQIMADPVTTITGITYDRQSIEQWLAMAQGSACPVTNQPLSKDSGLTPNHTLRRLIQAWCVANAEYGVDGIPTPKIPLDVNRVTRIIRDIKSRHHSPLNSLKMLETLAAGNEKTRKCLLESGAADCLISIINRSHRENTTAGLHESLTILNQIWSPTAEISRLVRDNHELIDSIAWILDSEVDLILRAQAALLTKKIFEIGNSSLKGRLGGEFIRGSIRILRENAGDSATNAALRVLVEASQCAKNRLRMIEANAVFELIELELRMTGKKVSELVFCLLSQLCCSADGRAQLLSHAAGIAVVSNRMLRVSAEVDERAVHIVSALARFSATRETLLEMLRVETVSKLCMVLQTDCPKYLKDKVRDILRMHSSVWNNSPCIQIHLFLD
ncbi:hypothetical protein Dimus_009314 [Dionaea muscipula]